MKLQTLILFDSECILCLRFKNALEVLDTKKMFKFWPIYDHQIYQDFPALTFENCQKEIHIVNPKGEVLVAGEAINYLAKSLPAVRKIAWLTDSNSSQKAMGYFYDHLNRFRKSKKNCKTCR